MIEERHQQILDILFKKQYASVNYLSKELFVSPPTIRRDLIYLSNKNLIKRSHGGAMSMSEKNNDIPIEFRNGIKYKEKITLAKAAAALAKEGDIIFIDASTTTLHIVDYIKNLNDIIVITNSMQVINLLKNYNITTYCTGGVLVENSFAFCGRLAESVIKEFNIDIMFFSSYSISEKGVISDYSEIETSLRKTALNQSKTKVFLCDNDKFCKSSAFIVTTINDIDYFITNGSQIEAFDNSKTKIILA